jgi:hypothetical protein
LEQIWVAELDENEIHEDEAVRGIAAEMACGTYEVQIAPGGRANVLATASSCFLVDEDLLRHVNCTSGLAIATCLNFSLAWAGQRIATVKSAPFAVPKSDFEGSINMLRERGPILQARPIQPSPIGVLYCDSVNGDRARTMFERILRQKLEKFGIHSHIGIALPEHEDHISCGIQHLLRSKAGAVLIVSPTLPAGRMRRDGRWRRSAAGSNDTSLQWSRAIFDSMSKQTLATP